MRKMIGSRRTNKGEGIEDQIEESRRIRVRELPIKKIKNQEYNEN